MNIIASNCVGARLYEIANQQFTNPFMWSIVLPKDFIFLIKNFNQLDFNHITPINIYWDESKCDVPALIIDNKIKVIYIHHKQDKNALYPIKRGINLYYKDIFSYLIDAWKRRIKRLSTKNLHFLAIANIFWNKSDIIEFAQLQTPFKKSLIVYDKKYLYLKSNSLNCVYIKNRKDNTYKIAKQFLTTCNKNNYKI